MSRLTTVGEEQVREQHAAYAALLQGLGQATFPEIEKALADREKVEPEPGLRPEVVRTMKRRIDGRGS
jgi:hypothetical protein